MAESKRYYWLRLHDDFFNSKRIKKLRKMAGGDTYTIIYLKMQLLAMKSGGILTYTGLEDNFADELALDIDESCDDVRITLTYLLGCGLAETSDNVNFFLPYAVENTGSETASTQRSRECRQRQKVLQCNNNATTMQQTCIAEKEIEKEIEIEKKERKKFSPPTLEEVEEYCRQRKNNVDAKRFYDYFSEGEWKDSKGQPVKNWKQKVITWEKFTDKGKGSQPATHYDADDDLPF